MRVMCLLWDQQIMVPGWELWSLMGRASSMKRALTCMHIAKE